MAKGTGRLVFKEHVGEEATDGERMLERGGRPRVIGQLWPFLNP